MSHGFFEPGSSQDSQIYALTGIDAKTVADHLLMTTANEGKSFLVTRMFVYYTTVSGYISGSTFNLGSNGANYNNIVNSGSLGAIVAPGNAVDQVLAGSTPAVVDPNTGIYFRIATGGSGTTLTIAVVVTGHYLP